MAYLLNRLVDEAAERAPDREYLRFETTTLSYAETAARKNQVAHTLRAHGVQPGDRVGIYARKGIEGVLGMYGTLEAGAAFVPLDPWLPAPKLAEQLRDCGIRVLFTDSSRLRTLRKIEVRETPLGLLVGLASSPFDGVASLDWPEIGAAPKSTPPESAIELDLAYIYYTSGSTGPPKGMMLTHSSGLTFVDWAVRTFGLHAGDIIGSQAPLHFDLSIFDFMASAAAGARTVIVPEEHIKVPASVSKLLADEEVSVLYWVPIALMDMLARGALDSRDLSRLRWILFAGEVFPMKHLRQLAERFPQAKLANLYGVTEANVTHHFVLPDSSEDWPDPLPVGRLSTNMEAVILDDDAETEGSGELAIRGPAVMRCYWNRPQLNESVFWTRQSGERAGDRFYKTGDLVRRDEDGLFQLLGRKDRQVKSRGHRIELDEVQAAVASFEAVRETAVYATPDPGGSIRIEAAVAMRTGLDLDEAALLQHVRNFVPSYAAPAVVRVMEKLPRTSAGKIDWRALSGDGAVAGEN